MRSFSKYLISRWRKEAGGSNVFISGFFTTKDGSGKTGIQDVFIDMNGLGPLQEVLQFWDRKNQESMHFQHK